MNSVSTSELRDFEYYLLYTQCDIKREVYFLSTIIIMEEGHDYNLRPLQHRMGPLNMRLHRAMENMKRKLLDNIQDTLSPNQTNDVMTLLEEFRSELETQPPRDEFDTVWSTGGREPSSIMQTGHINNPVHTMHSSTPRPPIPTAASLPRTPSSWHQKDPFQSDARPILKTEPIYLTEANDQLRIEMIRKRRQELERANSNHLSYEKEADLDGMQKYFQDWQNQENADPQFSRAQHQRPPVLNQQKKVSWEEEHGTSRPLSGEETPSSYPYSRDGPRHSTPKSENRNLSSFFQELGQKSANNHQHRRGNFDSPHQPKSPSEYEGQFDSADEEEHEEPLEDQNYEHEHLAHPRSHPPINPNSQYQFVPPQMAANFIHPTSAQPSHIPNPAFPAWQQPIFLQSSPTPRHEQHSKVPTFNGKTSFQDFIIQFDCVSDINKWSNKVKGQKLLMALEGQAASVLTTLPSTKRTDYYHLRAALDKRFNPQLDPDLAGSVAQTRRKKRGETYVAYAQELKKLMNMAYDNWPPDCIERLIRERFFNSIEDPHMRGMLWSRSPRTVDEAAVMADGLEKLMESPTDRPTQQAVYSSEQRHDRSGMNQNEGYQGDNPNRRFQRQNSHSDRKGRWSERSSPDQRSRNPPPDRRNRPDHRYRRDETRPLHPQNNGSASNRGSPPRSSYENGRDNGINTNRRDAPSFKCHYCKKPGHYASSCFQNPNRKNSPSPRQGRSQQEN